MTPLQTRAAALAAAWALIVAVNAVVLPRLHTPRAAAETVALAPMDLFVQGPGVLKPALEVTLKAEFEGPVVRKLFTEGTRVKKGDVLVELGRDKIQASHLAKSNSLQNAKNDLAKAVAELALQKSLYEKMAVARYSVDEAERAVGRAKQEVEMATSAFALEERRWNMNLVRSPIDGKVTRDALGPDGSVTSGKELAAIGDVSSYSMEIQVDQLEISQVKEGQSALVRLQALNRPLKASVSEIGAITKGEKGSTGFPVRLAIAKEESVAALPGFTGKAVITVGKTEPVLSVPAAAVATTSGRTFVWTLDGAGRLRQRAVTTGRSSPERVEITGGLVAGERVCASHDGGFREGLRAKTGD